MVRYYCQSLIIVHQLNFGLPTASLELLVNLAGNIHEANVIRHYLAANFVVRKAFHVQTSVREQSEVIKPAYPFQRECIKGSVKLNEK